MSNQSPIFVKTEAFMVWMFDHTTKYPKKERFRLAQRLDNTLLDFHRCLVLATQAEQPQPILNEAQIHLELLRAYLRLGVEMKYTSPTQFKYASEYTTEIGRLLGGWKKKS